MCVACICIILIHVKGKNYIALFGYADTSSLEEIPLDGQISVDHASYDYKHCTKRVTNVAYIKTRKTGSSTITNILYRYHYEFF